MVTRSVVSVRAPTDGWDQEKWCFKMGRLCSPDMEEHLPESPLTDLSKAGISFHTFSASKEGVLIASP